MHVDVVAGHAAHAGRTEQFEAVLRGCGGERRLIQITGFGVDRFQGVREALGGARREARHPDLHEVAPDVQAVSREDGAQRLRLELAAGPVKRRGKPPFVAEILVAGHLEVPGPDRVRTADFKLADAALVAREAVEARHGEGDLVFVPALGRQVRQRRKRGADGLLLVARQPVPR